MYIKISAVLLRFSGFICGDPTPHNILVSEKLPKSDPPRYKIAGFIDWADVHNCVQVFDLAICCMHMMSGYREEWNSNLNERSVAKDCIDGFRSVLELSEAELRLLPILIMTRYAQSLTIGAYNYYVLDPNNTYLLTTARNGWRQLHSLWESDRVKLLKMWTGLD